DALETPPSASTRYRISREVPLLAARWTGGSLEPQYLDIGDGSADRNWLVYDVQPVQLSTRAEPKLRVIEADGDAGRGTSRVLNSSAPLLFDRPGVRDVAWNSASERTEAYLAGT